MILFYCLFIYHTDTVSGTLKDSVCTLIVLILLVYVDTTQQILTSRFCVDTACVETIDAIETLLCKFNVNCVAGGHSAGAGRVQGAEWDLPQARAQVSGGGGDRLDTVDTRYFRYKILYPLNI